MTARRHPATAWTTAPGGGVGSPLPPVSAPPMSRNQVEAWPDDIRQATPDPDAMAGIVRRADR